MNMLQKYVMYEIEIESLVLKLKSGKNYEFPETLSNGRANYILFEELVRQVTGLKRTAHSDHTGDDGKRYEQKAFFDAGLYPDLKYDFFQTSASNTFSANNNGPKIDAFLKGGLYESALKICNETGYSHNDFYIYTNTRGYSPIIPMRYFIFPTKDVIANLSSHDPRLISRRTLLSNIQNTIKI